MPCTMDDRDGGGVVTPAIPVPRESSRQQRVRMGASTLWRALPPIGRLALIGLLASAMAAILLGLTITTEIKRQLLDAEGRGLQAAVAAIEPALMGLGEPPLGAREMEALDRTMSESVLGGTHVRAKLWTIDGTIVYSDVHELIGRAYPEVRPRLAEASAVGVISEVTDLAELENEFERQYERLIEYYVPVRYGSGATTAVLEIYTDVGFLEEALARVSFVTWATIGSGIAILVLFLAILVSSMVRSISRDRAFAETRAAELGILVDAMDALSSSLVPEELLRRLEASIRRRLGIDTLSIEVSAPTRPEGVGVELRDGTWLVATRGPHPPAPDDERILRAVGDSLDAALENASLYAEVSDAARQRRQLLRRLAEAHDEERHRIVGELHDSLAADLISVLYGIRGIAGRSAGLPPEIGAEILRLETLVQETETHLRALMGRVQPVAIASDSFDGALELLASRAREETGLEVRVRNRGAADDLAPEAQQTLIRATEEALINVRKHAHARRVLIRTSSDGRHLRLSIDDDGVGWSERVDGASGRGLGLAYVEERVAAIGGTVERARGRLGGARIVMSVPVVAAR